MSPRVILRCYPKGDHAFTAHADVTLTIELPDSYTPDQVVTEIVRRLRETHPLADVRVEQPQNGDGRDDVPTWHVFRDGEPGLIAD